MSDLEDDQVVPNGHASPLEDPVEDVIDDEEPNPAHQKSSKQRRRAGDEEEEEEEEHEDDDEDEDEDEDDEDAGRERAKKRPKHRHKRPLVNRFLDVEAEVDTEEEEEEEEEEYGRDTFIAEPDLEGDDDDFNKRTSHHMRLDRREQEMNDEDLAKIAEGVARRYQRTATRYTGDMNEVPQRLLMPSVQDANLWQLKVKPGRERDIVFSLMRKAINLEFSSSPLQILSVFQRDSLPGMIYVEARSAAQVKLAVKGLAGAFNDRDPALVPIDEMASLLQIKKQDITVTPGSWVRIKRGKYQGDLAQVMDITETGEEVGLKFVPRIDLNPKEDAGTEGKKRKKIGAGTSITTRPPQRFFNYEEVVRAHGRKAVTKRNQVYVFQGDTYKDGFIEKDIRITGLILDNINPTLDEITRFTRGQDGAENESNVDLSIIAEASRKAAITVLQPGDHVEVFEGEQTGVHGTVESIEQDVVSLIAEGVEIDGQKIDVPARSVRKRFKAGDHVKVMSGQNADETGLVVSVTDNVVTFWSDVSNREISVFSKDIRESAEVGASSGIVGNYELHDLVQLDPQTAGVIFKAERDAFRILDQNGQVRIVQPHQISMRRDSNRAIATDSEGNELRVHDTVKEVDGEGRKGVVLHVHQSFFAFLQNRDIVENGGIFVTRARSLVSLAPKSGIPKPGAQDLTKMNPALSGGGLVGSSTFGRGPRDRLIGVTVVVIKGAHKGYTGAIKDTNGGLARVELHTGNKVISVDKSKLKRRLPNGTLEPLEGGNYGQTSMGPPDGAGGRTPGPQGGRTPGWNTTGRTPNPYNATPSWNGATRTPNPYGDGGKTPGWGSKTPNPYEDAGRTPSRTPNPYGQIGGWGGATPGRPAASGGWGGATPGRPTAAWTGAASPHPSGWAGNQTPRPNAQDSWDGSSPVHVTTWEPTSPGWGPSSAPTPGTGWTPSGLWGPTTSASTPSPWGTGATPAASAATPYDAARTPGAVFRNANAAAATPAASGWGPIVPGSSEDEDVPPMWLADIPTKVDPQIIVVLKGTRGPDGWHQGDYEGKRCQVLTVLDLGGSYARTATVKLLNSSIVERLTVPIQYLEPVPPEQNGDNVLVFLGPHKGKLGVVAGRVDEAWLVNVENSYCEVREKHIVKRI